jgi:hypothetical protein
MENRDRDKMSKNSSSTPAGDVNRNTSSNIGKEKSDSESSFGQGIGRSESWDSEPSRRSGSDSDSNLGEQTDVSSDRKSGSWSEREH